MLAVPIAGYTDAAGETLLTIEIVANGSAPPPRSGRVSLEAVAALAGLP